MKITRVCYATREEVKRTMDIKHAAWNADIIDRNITQASESVDDLCNRVFFPADATRYFDWPNYQYAATWRLWLNQNDIAVSPIVKLTTGGITIPANQYILRPENSGPPYTSIELLRNTSAAFGAGVSPQQDIGVQATFGYWNKLVNAGTLKLAMSDTTTGSATVSSGASPGVGDMILVDSERMIVQGRSAIDTTVNFTGLSSASAQDNQIQVPDATLFGVGETLLVDDERLLLVDAIGNTLIVRRAFDGSQLAAHTGGTLWALRKLTVTRGDLGTSAATHLNNAPISVLVIPSLIKELALAWAELGVVQGPSAYSSPGQQREPYPGAGIGDLCSRVETAYGRPVRKRAI